MSSPSDGLLDHTKAVDMIPTSTLSGKRYRSATPPSEAVASPKRTRVDEEVEDILRVPEPLQGHNYSLMPYEPPAEEPVVRDDTYYMPDGSCVLQVERTLFNVHRTLLAKDSSLFSTMFELPQGDHEVEGRSDESPIYLQGESVSEFKNFLWVLYALPHEVADITAPQIDLLRLNRLIDIAKVSFKYHFRSLETWALDVINDHVNRKPPPPIFCLPNNATIPGGTTISISSLTSPTPPVSSPQAIASNGALVSRLMRLAQLCGHERLLNTMIAVLKQLMGYSIQYAHLAMTLADELDLRALRGIAYFEVMQKGNVVVAQTHDSRDGSSDANAVVDAEGRLIVTHEQKLRLLTGYYRLTMAWERFRATPLTFEHSPACGATWHQHGCTQCWLDFWKEKTKSDAVLSLGLADVLGRLRAIVKEFVKWGSATYMHQDCRTAVRKLIQEKIKVVEDELPDYFVEEGLSSL